MNALPRLWLRSAVVNGKTQSQNFSLYRHSEGIASASDDAHEFARAAVTKPNSIPLEFIV